MCLPRPLLALCGLLAIASTAFAYKGDGTAYSGCGEHSKTGAPSCGLPKSELSGKWNCYYAALPMGCGEMSGGCGECIRACGDAGCEIVKVIDTCAGGGCPCGNVDFSKDALKAVTGYEWDRKPITWEWVDSCDEDAGDGVTSSARLAAVEEDDSKDSKKDDNDKDDDDDKKKKNNNDNDDDDKEEKKKKRRKNRKGRKNKKNRKGRKNRNNDRRLMTAMAGPMDA